MNIKQADSAILMGTSRVKRWAAVFLERWQQPYSDAMIVLWFRQLDPLQREMLKAQSPEAYAKVKAMVEGMEEVEDVAT
jgi:hypothetical protein